jgi:hypothetical protein
MSDSVVVGFRTSSAGGSGTSLVLVLETDAETLQSRSIAESTSFKVLAFSRFMAFLRSSTVSEEGIRILETEFGSSPEI